jgi:hypothetical protein
MVRKLALLTSLSLMLLDGPAHARNFQLKGKNELCGGIGFAGDLTDWTPGGFKWFNDYSRQLSKLTWLNFQFNVVLGGGGGRDCWVDNKGRWHCDYRRHFGGYAIELAVGVKLKWRLRTVPLQFHAKFGGAFDIIVFDDYYYDNVYADDSVAGLAIGFRGGFGVRYFFIPTLGVGAELIPTFGPAFLNHGLGVEPYGSIDFNTGVEWRF